MRNTGVVAHRRSVPEEVSLPPLIFFRRTDQPRATPKLAVPRRGAAAPKIPENPTLLTPLAERFTIVLQVKRMSGKAVAVGVTALILVVFLLSRRDSSSDSGVSLSESRLARSSAVSDRPAARPNVFGTGLDAPSAQQPGNPGGANEQNDDRRAGHRDARAAGARQSALQAAGSTEPSSLDLRARLRDPSRPLPVEPDAFSDAGSLPPTGSAWSSEADVESLEAAVPERIHPDQPVLSLFDGDGAAGAVEASVERGVVFDTAGARFSPDSELAIPMAGKISGQAGSISFWVRPEAETSDVDNASLVQLRSHYEFGDRLQIWKDGASVRLVFADSTGTESGVVYAGSSWAPQEWRLVTATWGNGENALYINGELVGRSHYEGSFRIRPDTLLHIGSNYSEDPRSLTGTISRFRVYDRTLGAEEVAELPSEYPE